MLRAAWTGGSLRFWVSIGMMLTVMPLAVSAFVGYVMLDRGVIAAFRDVATRQRDQINPIQNLRLALWEVSSPVENYLDSGRAEEMSKYRAFHEQLEEMFIALRQKMKLEPQEKTLIDRAYDDWTSADHVAATIFSQSYRAGDAHGVEFIDKFDDFIAAAVGKLGAAHKVLIGDVKRDHSTAEETYVRAEKFAVAAAIVSILMMISGIVLIGRFMLASVDRLVDGAARFAAGDRDHRIEIQVPPELRRVATEFNQMITRIRETESELADLALRDALTGLLNRRAFDDAMAEVFARMRRFDEKAALVMFDLDHFKNINDTYGHSGGDDVLRAVAEAMVKSVRDIDKVFRIGGEEFAVLLQGADMAASEVAAERLRTSISGRSISMGENNVTVTISGGIALAQRTDTIDALIKRADEALYRAKTGGRNRVLANESNHG